jgi:hypothetical protein
VRPPNRIVTATPSLGSRSAAGRFRIASLRRPFVNWKTALREPDPRVSLPLLPAYCSSR